MASWLARSIGPLGPGCGDGGSSSAAATAGWSDARTRSTAMRHAARARKARSFSRCLPSTIAIELQESLLHRVFGVVGVEQDGIGHAKDETRLALDERSEVRIFVAGQGLRAPSGYRRKLHAVAEQLYCLFTR